MHTQSHRSDPRILGRRTLQRDHRHLATLLRPGLSVLDVGCGTGAITAGIAHATAPHGRVIGLDRDDGLLELARKEHGGQPNLQFQQGDATTMNFQGQFDILTAARVLQWIAAPAMAISRMKDAAKPGGMLVVLDYNHASNLWDPDPPSAFRQFYAAFLAWRSANQWDNEMAGHLPDLLRHAGLTAVESHLQDEVVERGDPEFSERTAIWLQVIEGVGEQIATAGFSTVSELQSARDAYAGWIRSELRKQTLVLRAVTGRKPDDPFTGA